jgi:S1-C subfamily serine protease
MVTVQCHERTVRVNVPGGSFGSGVLIDVRDKQWLVTARHVIQDVDPGDIELVRREGKVKVRLQRVPELKPKADVAIFQLDQRLVSESLPVHLTDVGLVLGQDAYLLGFPLGIGVSMSDEGFYPFVKRATVSTNITQDGVKIWLVDGINNEGMSGGPVVFCKVGTTDWHVLGVMAGHLREEISIKESDLKVEVNSGIVVVHDIGLAVSAIEAFLDS